MLLLQGELLYTQLLYRSCIIQLLAFKGIFYPVIAGEPAALRPLSIYSCPNDESVTFTCSGNQLSVIEWSVKPYFSDTDGDLSYIPLRLMNDPGPQIRSSSNNTFLDYSELTNFSRIDEAIANMTTSLTVKTSGVRNETNIICILVGYERLFLNATIYFAS